jgi:hypothetical protein
MAKMIDPQKQVRKKVRTIVCNGMVITVVRREFEVGRFCNDILIDGHMHSPANGDSILEEMLVRTQYYVNSWPLDDGSDQEDHYKDEDVGRDGWRIDGRSD